MNPRKRARRTISSSRNRLKLTKEYFVFLFARPLRIFRIYKYIRYNLTNKVMKNKVLRNKSLNKKILTNRVLSTKVLKKKTIRIRTTNSSTFFTSLGVKKTLNKKLQNKKILYTQYIYSKSLHHQEIHYSSSTILPLPTPPIMVIGKVRVNCLGTFTLPSFQGLSGSLFNSKLHRSKLPKIRKETGSPSEFKFSLLDHLKKFISNDMFAEDEARFRPKIIPNFLIKLGFSNKIAKMQKVKKKMSSFPNINQLLKRIIRKKYRFFSFFKSNRRFQPSTLNPSTGLKLNFYKNYSKDKFLNSYEYSIKKYFAKKKHKGHRFIKRIKFKPGYIIQWKRARKTFQELLKLNFRYEKRLTMFFKKFRKKHFYNLLKNSLTVKHVFMSSHMFLTNKSFNFALSNSLVYLNGNRCAVGASILIKNDLVSLLLFTNFYMYFVFNRPQFILNKIKVKKWFFYQFRRFKQKPFQTKKHNWSRKYFGYTDYYSDIPNFIEYDFLTQSGLILYSQPLIMNFKKNFDTSNPVWIYKNYNWKYVV